MFVACVRADSSVLPSGIDDSKRLSPARREALATELHADERVSVAVAEVTPAEIDDTSTDLNTLTVEANAVVIDSVATDGLVGMLDACDTDAARFGRRVADATNRDIEIESEHGADEQYALVGAASIVAKVARDTHIEKLAEEYGSLGSGYPSDPKTRKFLREYVREYDELPSIVRTSWQTSRDVLEAAEQSALAEF